MKVSVLIPVYNVEKYIARCLDSVLAQTFQDFEIIVVDDCGTDNSMRIVNEYAEKDHRIKIIHHDKNHGPMVARQTGYTNANGEYLIFLDSDDYLPEDALEYLYDRIYQTGADMVVGNIADIMVDGSEIVNVNQSDAIYNRQEAIRLFLTRAFRHSLCGRIFNHQLFSSSFEVYDKQNNSEDLLITAQLLKRCEQIVITNKIVYKYVLNPTSSTHSNYTESTFRNMVFATNAIWHILNKQSDEQLLNNYLTHRIKDICLLGVPKKILKELTPDISALISFNNCKKLYGTKGIIYYLICRNSLFRQIISHYRNH